MFEPFRDTIFALSSGRPPVAIAVVRVSGPGAGAALKALIGKLPVPREAALARVRDPASNEAIDQALALWFPAPNSETGEDTAELQLHGGRAVVAATLSALARLPGLRPAEAGEFTRRAFENGKLDLTAVEGLADLVAAATEGQRRQALRQLQGALGNRAEDWRLRLIKALALVEARIDFSDEADVPEDLLRPALTIARELEGEIAAALADGGRGERLREGLTVAIAGPPNAGKSTLLNRLAKREAAIVSPYAGTTRDVIEVHLDLSGWPVTLLDTAGIRETSDPVEMEGVRRAQQRAQDADLVLWVVDAADEGAGDGAKNVAAMGAAKNTPVISGRPDLESSGSGVRARRLAAFGLQRGAQNDKVEPLSSPPVWLVRNKIDMIQSLGGRNESKNHSIARSDPVFDPTKSLKNIVNNRLTHSNESGPDSNEFEFNISALTGGGFEALLQRLQGQAEGFLAGGESALVTRERHRRALEETLAALHRAQAPEVAAKEDLLAEEFRLATRALGRLTGRVDVEDILDVIFRDFCIGK
jgi:tRNA modification GTPase